MTQSLTNDSYYSYMYMYNTICEYISTPSLAIRWVMNDDIRNISSSHQCKPGTGPPKIPLDGRPSTIPFLSGLEIPGKTHFSWDFGRPPDGGGCFLGTLGRHILKKSIFYSFYSFFASYGLICIPSNHRHMF